MTAAFTPSLRPARKLFAVLLCLGGGLFVIFLTFALQHYGLANLGEYLFRVRLDLGVGDVPPGFYFLYFAEPLPPMALVMAQLQPQRRRRYYVIAGLAFLALTLTSGRTNVIKAALWCLCTLLLDGKHRWMRVKGLTYIAVCAAAGLLFFIVAGNLIGKNFSHSELSGALGSDASLPTQLAVPYLYATGALPTLEHVMDQPTSPASRGTTIRPILQLAAIVDPQIQVPAKVQPFYNVPYRFNVSTFIGPLYRDLGVIGMAIYTALLGAVSALLYVSYVRSPTPCLRLLVALFMVTGTLTVGDLPLNNLSYVLQIALLGFAAQMEHLGVSRTRPFQTQELPQASDLERSGFKVDAEAPRL
jgi:oligosaccharide repeat unit polymerase